MKMDETSLTTAWLGLKGAYGRAGRNLALALAAAALAAAILLSTGALHADTDGEDAAQSRPAAPASLEETRMVMDKCIQNQQMIAKRRKEWQQGKDVLQGRIDLVEKEITGLEQKIKEDQAKVTETNKKRDEMLAEDNQLKATIAQLTTAVTGMEGEMRRLGKALPEPLKVKLDPLYKRIPEDPAKTRSAAAERFQNVLGILNEANKANNEITVNYEVHQLAGGTTAEVQAIYVGLAQAYFVSASGEAGICQPTLDGWKWETSKTIARDVLTVLEILQGKQTAAFVPLPVKIQ
ncbi:MAG: DUF3450 family protein [Planctomycetota bacterium]|nr:DUF3450 family protein [Planctomycetota bacterium]